MERGDYTLEEFIDNLNLNIGQSQRILGTAYFEIKPYKDKDTIRCWVKSVSKEPKLTEYEQIDTTDYDIAICVSHSLCNFDLGTKLYSINELKRYMSTKIHYFNL